jgi:uncharacterized membrane protein YheB (UPF0754 family)
MLEASYFLIPFISGLVGFVTNAIAIRMLFRPHTARWYTLGWQGIIPRTRSELAKKISDLVGKKLVTEQEICAALKAPQFSERFLELIHSAFEQLRSPNYQIALSETLFSDPEFNSVLNRLSISLNNYLKEKVYSLKIVEIGDFLSHADFIDNPRLRQAVEAAAGKKIAEGLHHILTLESIADLYFSVFRDAIPLDKPAEDMIEEIIPLVSALFSDTAVIDEVNNIVIAAMKEKNLLTAGAAEVFKRKIKKEIAKKLPSIGEKISDSPVVKGKLKDTAKKKMAELSAVKVRDLLGERFYPFLQTAPLEAVRRFLSEGLSAAILGALNRYYSPEESVGEILEKHNIELDYGICLADIFRDNFGKFLNAVLSDEVAEAITRRAGSETFAALISKTFVNTVDIAQVVENKINSLNTAEVEEMIFSFTKTHFKWINLLGFLIGFLVGIIQVAFTIWDISPN